MNTSSVIISENYINHIELYEKEVIKILSMGFNAYPDA